jgi:hypothetical protein
MRIHLLRKMLAANVAIHANFSHEIRIGSSARRHRMFVYSRMNHPRAANMPTIFTDGVIAA